jgi:hypothetical protein
MLLGGEQADAFDDRIGAANGSNVLQGAGARGVQYGMCVCTNGMCAAGQRQTASSAHVSVLLMIMLMICACDAVPAHYSVVM